MSASIMPIPKPYFTDNNGAPLAGGKVYTYSAGTTTPKATYTDSTGGTPNANPVVLDSAGRASIWLNGYYKIILKDADDVTIYTMDNVSSKEYGTTAAAVTEWTASGLTLTYISATQFSVAGDYTSVFATGARLKAIVSAGTIYGTVQSSAYAAAVTTVTCYWDSGSLDSGLSAISTGIITPTNTSLPDYAITQRYPIYNLKVSKGASNNILNVLAKNTGLAPNALNRIGIGIPDGTGFTMRYRTGSYLGGAGVFTLADGTNYWGRTSVASEIKTAWLYATWDGTGIVLALSGYSGFTMVPTTTTATDDDYFLLEDGSTYTRSNSHYCVAICRIRYEFDTGDTPDYTIQTGVENAPTIMWNPRSDYARQVNFATTNTSASDISEASQVSAVVKQTGLYKIEAHSYPSTTGTSGSFASTLKLKTGSATYGSATQRSIQNFTVAATGGTTAFSISVSASAYLSNGDTIHLGADCLCGGGNRIIYGDSTVVGATAIIFRRTD